MPDFTDIFNRVHGFLSLTEAELLYRLASEVPAGGVIVEIGAFQGRSTVCLGLGAQASGAMVYSIDPHTERNIIDELYGMADNQKYYEALAAFQVGNVVKTINDRSQVYNFGYLTDLLWIDGSHLYEDVEFDFKKYSKLVTPLGKIAIHDTAGYHPGVTKLLNEVLAIGKWKVSEAVDAMTVLERV